MRKMMLGKKYYGFVWGQVISLCLTGTGVFSELLARDYANLPGFQNWFNYCLLCLVHGVRWSYDTTESVRDVERTRDQFGRLRVAWWVYMLIAFIDVEANFLAVLAYRYTNITRATLLNCFTIPMTMVLSRVFLKTVYGKHNYLGIAVYLVGLLLVVLPRREEDDEAPNKLAGDLLTIAGAFLYSVSNVAQEAMMKRYDRTEYLFFLGFFGTFFSIVQVMLFDWDTLVADVNWDAVGVSYMCGYGFCLFAMYNLVALFLETFDAAMLDLSLISSCVWAAWFGLVLFNVKLTATYFVASAIIMSGIVIYNSALPKQLEHVELPVEPELTSDDTEILTTY